MQELLKEIYQSFCRNKLRTILSGFSVAWGIFMLVILSGMANGYKNGISESMITNNHITIIPRYTSLPYKGYNAPRKVSFDTKDLQLLASVFPDIDNLSGSTAFQGQLIYDNNMTPILVNGVMPAFFKNNKLRINEGRFINTLDLKQYRKVVVLTKSTAQTIANKENLIGTYVNINQIAYKIIGIVEPEIENENNLVYLPLSTIADLQGGTTILNSIDFTANHIHSLKESDLFIKDIHKLLSLQHNFSPKDENALWILNGIENFLSTKTLFKIITIFVWLIGLSILLIGIIGVSNIMIISVRERTNEFGIRKSLGARPISLIKMIISESIIITTFFGYIGMVAGIAVTEFINNQIIINTEANPNILTFFKNPTLNISITISATIILILSGVIAGYIPAKKAVNLKTIDAIRYK
ncbi:MAG TPA: ABC transporter permease [Candidatus Avirikenella pullistercoris]|nr:ABC transporter permease [Candidatus Avirikenella pullistercoris]